MTTARTIQEASDKAIDLKNQAQNKASELRDDATDRANELKEKVQSVIYELASELKDRASTAQAYLSSGSEVVKDKTLEANEQFVKCVRTHPWKSVGAAALVGYLLGKML